MSLRDELVRRGNLFIMQKIATHSTMPRNDNVFLSEPLKKMIKMIFTDDYFVGTRQNCSYIFLVIASRFIGVAIYLLDRRLLWTVALAMTGKVPHHKIKKQNPKRFCLIFLIRDGSYFFVILTFLYISGKHSFLRSLVNRPVIPTLGSFVM